MPYILTSRWKTSTTWMSSLFSKDIQVRRLNSHRLSPPLLIPSTLLAVTENLGQVEKVEVDQPAEFADRITKFIESGTKSGASAENGGGEGQDFALWPLIREVRVSCNAKALSKGTVLVDLPGKPSPLQANGSKLINNYRCRRRECCQEQYRKAVPQGCRQHLDLGAYLPGCGRPNCEECVTQPSVRKCSSP